MIRREQRKLKKTLRIAMLSLVFFFFVFLIIFETDPKQVQIIQNVDINLVK
jgi:hypothetical protein